MHSVDLDGLTNSEHLYIDVSTDSNTVDTTIKHHYQSACISDYFENPARPTDSELVTATMLGGFFTGSKVIDNLSEELNYIINHPELFYLMPNNNNPLTELFKVLKNMNLYR